MHRKSSSGWAAKSGASEEDKIFPNTGTLFEMSRQKVFLRDLLSYALMERYPVCLYLFLQR